MFSDTKEQLRQLITNQRPRVYPPALLRKASSLMADENNKESKETKDLLNKKLMLLSQLPLKKVS